MAQFYTDDVCAFKSDPFIVGTVEHTWRGVDGEFDDLHACYRHYNSVSDTTWHELVSNRRPPTGYVVLSFAEPHDMFALISESSLKLVDRALSVGDIVKRQLSDAESGTIISTSISCDLRPTCSASRYVETRSRKVNGLCARDSGFHDGASSHCSPLCRPFDVVNSYELLNELHAIPAHELEYWTRYREQDYIIFQNWVGRIRHVLDEVTVRLTNGSVVVVDGELRQPYWVEGSDSAKLLERIARVSCMQPMRENKARRKSQECEAEPCYPGQIVQTTKGNLRKGRWKFGAYDPNISPQGIVVEARTTEIIVDWTLPNVFNPNRPQMEPPPASLNLDALKCGQITRYNHSRKPRYTSDQQLAGASHSPDTGFGNFVRFKDPAGAATKYDGRINAATNNYFDRIPRTATQGFDMNVLEVRKTRTKVLVQWQDGTSSEEESVTLIPYNNVDEQDIWPGDYVSLQAGEEHNKDAGTIRCCKLGVVQHVQASDRIATVRWFQDAVANIAMEDKSTKFAPTFFGPISDAVSIVSLYDVACHPALGITRGDLVIPVPAQLPDAEFFRLESDQDAKIIIREAYENALRSIQSEALPESSTIPDLDQQGTLLPSTGNIDWFGEVVDVHLNGDVSVRLGAADEVKDIKIAVERCVFVTNASRGMDMSESSGDEDSEYDSVDSFMEDMSDSDAESVSSRKTIDMEIEYEGGDRLDDGSDEDMWSTEDEEKHSTGHSTNEQASNCQGLNPQAPIFVPPPAATRIDSMAIERDAQASRPKIDGEQQQNLVTSPTTLGLSSSDYPSIPAQSVLLDDAPPTDHHYINKPSSLAAPVLRRVMKELRIMQSSLPEGVFARTWESRLDLLRVLIIGPRDTPYELAPFVFDFHFTNSFPERPPDAYFHSWTDGRGRVNPNLYEDGTICLSLLGTWPGEGGKDTWSSSGSTILQLIVSLLGLVLVREPFYNEAGFEVLANTDESRTTSALYTERAFVLTRAFVQRALTIKPGGVSDIIDFMYENGSGPRLLQTIIEEAKARVNDGSGETSSEEKQQPKKLSRGASIMLERTLASLEVLQNGL